MISKILGFVLYYGIGMGASLTLLVSFVNGAGADRRSPEAEVRLAVVTSSDTGAPIGCPYLARARASGGCPYLASMAAAGCPAASRERGEPREPHGHRASPTAPGEERTLHPRLVASADIGTPSQQSRPAPPA